MPTLFWTDIANHETGGLAEAIVDDLNRGIVPRAVAILHDVRLTDIHCIMADESYGVKSLESRTLRLIEADKWQRTVNQVNALVKKIEKEALNG